MDTGRFEDETLRRFVDLVASDQPAPGGGAVAAVAVALAAGLVAMSARLSPGQLDDAVAVAAEADAIRDSALQLADDDAAAYRAVITARRLPKDDTVGRRAAMAAALERATEVPLEVARLGAVTAGLATRLAAEGNPNLEGDAAAAACLARAAARAAAKLVELNVRQGRLDDRWLETARSHVASAEHDQP
jgi:formiminotetrahydrofolate cyclodeaminase